MGVTSQIESDSGGSDGVGFAVSSKRSRGSPMADLERVGRPRLSRCRDPDLDEPGRSEDRNRPFRDTGRSLGAHAGDVVTAVDGEAVTSSDQLREVIDAHNPGDSVTITVSRNGKTQSLKVVLGTRPNA